MPKLAELPEVALDLEPASERDPLPPDDDAPFRILVLGDFSARNHRAIFEPGQLAWRTPIPVDIDTIESLMSRLAPALSLPVPRLPKRRIDLRFCEFNDFGPAVLSERLAVFAQLPPEDLYPALRYLVHHPDFQALEAAWRSLFFLLERTGAGANIQVHLLDVSKQELADDLCASWDFRDSGFYRILVNEAGTGAAHPWSLCLADYAFSPYIEDVEMLIRLARVGRHAGTPFLGAVRPDWPVDAGPAWQMLRESSEGSFVGLATPRFLVRPPYTPQPDIGFHFEEMPDQPAQDDYLWGNPAFLCAAVLLDEFQREGWKMTPGEWAEVDGLPVHQFNVRGELRKTLPLESALGDGDCQDLLQRGVNALVTTAEKPVVRVPQLLSIRQPATPLRGRWRSGAG